MFRKAILTIGAGIALVAQPVLAQDTTSDEDEILSALMGMFKAEPLTAEQEARLPLATEVVARMIPDGAMGEMMSSMFDGFLGPIMDKADEPSVAAVAEQLVVTRYELTMEESDAAEALAILDPAWTERKKIESGMMPELLNEIMTSMEPAMRKAMSEVYTVHFTSNELAEINTFFKTETGASFARKSFTISSDPRLIGSMMESMPEMMGSFMTMEQKVEEATASLPAVRVYEDLDAAERTRLASLLGMEATDLEAAMNGAEIESSDEDWGLIEE